MSDERTIWLDKKQAADLLGLTLWELMQRVRLGKLPRPSYHLGYVAPRWSLDVLDPFVKTRKRPRARPKTTAPRKAS